MRRSSRSGRARSRSLPVMWARVSGPPPRRPSASRSSPPWASRCWTRGRGFRIRTDVVRRVLRIGVPAAIEHLLMQVGFFLYIVFAAHHGTAPVAAYFIGVRILALSFLPGFGFAAAAATMVGQSLGGGRPDDAERSGGAAVRLALWLMTAAGVVILVAARPIARLFVDDAA